MQARIMSSLVAILVGSAFAAAQTPGARTQDAGAQPAYEHQLVTVEGCLERESAPAEVAGQVSDPERTAVFILVDTDVRSRIDTRPGKDAPADPRVLGPAGIQNERLGLPVDGVTEDTTDPADQRGTSPAVEGAPTPPTDRYLVQGLPHDRLKPFAGQRVAMTAQFEPPMAAIDRDVAAAEPVGTTGTGERWPGNLPQFRATSVKPVPGICVPKP